MPKIELNGIEMYYEKYGNGGDVIILLHGFLSSSKMWAYDYIPELAKTYTVYAFDLRGHGRSNHIKIGCNVKQMADDVHQFLNSKHIETCILAGMSMGGAVAIQFAIYFPERIQALILMNPGPGSLFSKGFYFILPILSLVSQKRCFLKPLLKSALTTGIPQNRFSDALDDAVLVNKKTWIHYLHPENKIHNFSNLKALTKPAIVIIGGKDTTVPITFQEDVADTLPNAVKIIMPEEGHGVVMENPEKVITEIYTFLKQFQHQT